MKILLAIISLLTLIGCSTPVKKPSSAQSNQIPTNKIDKTYGFTKDNPIKVGDGNFANGPSNERKYLNVLLGPNGEQVDYRRIGSCCSFKTANGFNGGGLLDAYEVTYKGLKKPKILYLNMYDSSKTKIPFGFKSIL